MTFRLSFWLILRKFGTVARFLYPARQDRTYLKVLRQSGLFDTAFYRHANPRLHPLFRLSPIRHYILHGESIGLCPNPKFSPRAYLFHNPDLTAIHPPIRPLLHYIETGHAEGRTTLWPEETGIFKNHLLPSINAHDIPVPTAPFAVVLHIYYYEFWEEIAPILATQKIAFDLYVTLTDGPDAKAMADQIIATMPSARIWILPNLGRDIFPFVCLLNAGLFEPYRAICKVHSKASPHRADGAIWRRQLIADILGSPCTTQTRLARFLADPRAGLWVANGQLYQGRDWWGTNFSRASELLERIGIDPLKWPLRFAAGSIYWVKPSALEGLRAMALDQRDFEPEQALVDGTTAHAMERAIGLILAAKGLEVRETRNLDTVENRHA